MRKRKSTPKGKLSDDVDFVCTEDVDSDEVDSPVKKKKILKKKKSSVRSKQSSSVENFFKVANSKEEDKNEPNKESCETEFSQNQEIASAPFTPRRSSRNTRKKVDYDKMVNDIDAIIEIQSPKPKRKQRF